MVTSSLTCSHHSYAKHKLGHFTLDHVDILHEWSLMGDLVEIEIDDYSNRWVVSLSWKQLLPVTKETAVTQDVEKGWKVILPSEAAICGMLSQKCIKLEYDVWL